MFKFEEILETTKQTLLERQAEYGSATESFQRLADLWSVVLGKRVTAVQVNLCLIQLKIIRLIENPTHADSMVDIIGYGALLPQVSGGKDDL